MSRITCSDCSGTGRIQETPRGAADICPSCAGRGYYEQMSKLYCDFTLITSADPAVIKHPAWNNFMKEMEGHAYGRGPLNSAWHFYKRGWETLSISLIQYSEINKEQ